MLELIFIAQTSWDPYVSCGMMVVFLDEVRSSLALAMIRTLSGITGIILAWH